MGSRQLRWLVIAQRCVLAGMLGMVGCGNDDGDDDAPDDDHGHTGVCDEEAGHHAEEDADGGEHDAEKAVGKASGATCPDDSTLTYDNFGKEFMNDYCVRCHSSELECEDRNGAPKYHDFDDLPGILLVANHIDQKAAKGPDSTNLMMPPDGAKPSLEDREKLGEWLACEIDKLNK